MIDILSMDEICKSPMPLDEKIKNFFPVGTRIRVGCFSTFILLTVSNGHKRVPFHEDIKAEVEDVDEGLHHWIVHTDIDGNKFGLAIGAMIGLHNQNTIEMDFIR